MTLPVIGSIITSPVYCQAPVGVKYDVCPRAAIVLGKSAPAGMVIVPGPFELMLNVAPSLTLVRIVSNRPLNMTRVVPSRAVKIFMLPLTTA